MQHGRVAETRENLRVGPDGIIIQQIRQAGAAVTAANHHDGAYIRVGKGAVEVAGAKLVTSRDESLTGGAGRVNDRNIS